MCAQPTFNTARVRQILQQLRPAPRTSPLWMLTCCRECAAVAVSALADPERHQLLPDLQHLHDRGTQTLNDQTSTHHTLTVGVELLLAVGARRGACWKMH